MGDARVAAARSREAHRDTKPRKPGTMQAQRVKQDQQEGLHRQCVSSGPPSWLHRTSNRQLPLPLTCCLLLAFILKRLLGAREASFALSEQEATKVHLGRRAARRL